jgi:hypothetical protein
MDGLVHGKEHTFVEGDKVWTAGHEVLADVGSVVLFNGRNNHASVSPRVEAAQLNWICARGVTPGAHVTWLAC